MAEVFLTPNDIAIELQCTVRTARGIVRKQIPHLRVGRFIRVKVGDYDRWKNRNRYAPQMPCPSPLFSDLEVTPHKNPAPSEKTRRERSKELAKQIREQAKRRDEK